MSDVWAGNARTGRNNRTFGRGGAFGQDGMRYGESPPTSMRLARREAAWMASLALEQWRSMASRPVNKSLRVGAASSRAVERAATVQSGPEALEQHPDGHPQQKTHQTSTSLGSHPIIDVAGPTLRDLLAHHIRDLDITEQVAGVATIEARVRRRAIDVIPAVGAGVHAIGLGLARDTRLEVAAGAAGLAAENRECASDEDHRRAHGTSAESEAPA
jgi:hypothetical protein